MEGQDIKPENVIFGSYSFPERKGNRYFNLTNICTVTSKGIEFLHFSLSNQLKQLSTTNDADLVYVVSRLRL